MVYHQRTELVRLLSRRLRLIINQTRPIVDDVLLEDAWFNQDSTNPSYRDAVKYYREVRWEARQFLRMLSVIRRNVEADDFEVHTFGMIKFVIDHTNEVWED